MDLASPAVSGTSVYANGLRLIVRSWLDVSTFATRRLHACHQARTPSGGRWNCGREMSRNFTEMTTSTPFRDLIFLHALKLRHGTDGFTSPPKGRCAEDFFALKIRRLRPGLNPRTWVPKVSTLLLDHRRRLVRDVKRGHSVWCTCTYPNVLVR